MKYLVFIIIALILTMYVTEGFIDYGTGIGPWWAQGPGLNRGYQRCVCLDNCICNKPGNYPQYYYN